MTTTTEWCSMCDHEVELKNEFVAQTCPNCNERILPCSICTVRQCSVCPLVTDTPTTHPKREGRLTKADLIAIVNCVYEAHFLLDPDFNRNADKDATHARQYLESRGFTVKRNWDCGYNGWALTTCGIALSTNGYLCRVNDRHDEMQPLIVRNKWHRGFLTDEEYAKYCLNHMGLDFDEHIAKGIEEIDRMLRDSLEATE